MFEDVVETVAEVLVVEQEVFKCLLKVMFALSEVDIICFTAALRSLSV